MMTVPIIATVLNAYISALTPTERWRAASKSLSGNDTSESVFVVVAFITLIILIVLLVIVSLRQTKNKQTKSNPNKDSGKKILEVYNDDLKIIENRRFLRVGVNYPAFVAPFPSSKEIVTDKDNMKANPGGSPDKASKGEWGPPEFVPGVVTELAGLGLCADVPSEVKKGERVLVVLKLGEEQRQDKLPDRGDSKKTLLKTVGIVGEVRQVEAARDGFSIAVELTGFIDSDVYELMNAAKEAFWKADGSDKEISFSAGDEQTTKEDVVETASV